MSDTTRIIYRLPRNYSAAVLRRAVTIARADASARFRTPDGETWDARRYLAWFRKSLHAKITARQGERDCRASVPGPYREGLRRDAARLKGYGGFGRKLETLTVRRKLNADHVHFRMDGSHRLCGDLDCEFRH